MSLKMMNRGPWSANNILKLSTMSTKFKSKNKRYRGKKKTSGVPVVRKFTTTTYNYTAISDVGVEVLPYQVAQGVDQNERIGHKIYPTYCELNLLFAPSAVDGTNTIRVSLAMPYDVQTTITDDGPAFYDPFDPFYWRVFLDRYIVMHSIENTTNGPAMTKPRIVMKVRIPLPVTFGSTTANSIQDHKLCFMIVSDSDTSTHPSASGWIRAYFKN
jgi:hypothetical protein